MDTFTIIVLPAYDKPAFSTIWQTFKILVFVFKNIYFGNFI